MFEPASDLTTCVLEHLDAAADIVHPHFLDVMHHAALPTDQYLAAAESDHSPISDLRLRRDESSRDLLELNLRAMAGQDPDFSSSVATVRRGATADRSLAGVRSALGVPWGRVGYLQQVERAIEQGNGESVLVALVRYVNVFGSWRDARDIARQVARSADDPKLGRERAVLLGLCGVVLALTGEPGAHELLRTSTETHPNPVQGFFMGLRHATILAKREHDPIQARRVVFRAEAGALRAGLHDADARAVTGMTSNFLGLLALQTHDLEDARARVDAAVDRLPAEPRRTVAIKDAEALRYASMARLNRAQIALIEQQYATAETELRALVDFASTQDRRVLHSAMSTLGYCLIRDGRAAEAVPVLQETLRHLRQEYDAAVVTQVRKLLYKAHVEVGDDAAAQEVTEMSPYFWQADQPRGADGGEDDVR